MGNQKSKWSSRSFIIASIMLALGLLAVLIVTLLIGQVGGDLPSALIFIVSAGVAGFSLRNSRKRDGLPAEQAMVIARRPNLLDSANSYEKILILGGAAALVISAIMAISAAGANSDSKQSNELLMLIGGFKYFDPDAGTEFSLVLWFGVALSVGGLLALGTFVGIRANRNA